MAQRPTLILDVMGADLGAAEMLHGAALACKEMAGKGFDLVVCADPSELSGIDQVLGPAAAAAGVGLTVLQSSDKLPKHFESPVDVYKSHPGCSIRMAMDRAKATPHSAVVSPGSTGLVMTAALFTLGRVSGIERAPIGTPLPTRSGGELFYVDGGSNVDARASHLYQFALLAHLYLKTVRKIERPSIALLSNGTEAYKGTPLIKEAYELLSADSSLNFVGYTEGHSMLDGKLDIMVCDGFIGNVLLKFAEGAADLIMGVIREELKKNTLAGLVATTVQRPVWRAVRKRLDYAQYGGAPLLGLNGNVVICHGRSSAIAIQNALAVAYRLAKSDIAAETAAYLKSHAQKRKDANGNGSGSSPAAGSPIGSADTGAAN